jgi:hypothetical protein
MIDITEKTGCFSRSDGGTRVSPARAIIKKIVGEE